MAGVKISGLPAVPVAPALTDLLPEVQPAVGGVTYKVTLSQIATLFNSNLTFLPLAGGTMSGNINMGGFKATNAADPTANSDYATKSYVDQTSLNGTSVYAASAATLGTVTQSGAGAGATLTNAGAQATFALDGVNPPVGSNVLIKNTATGMTSANEGIYTVTSAGSGATNWVLTRATSYDTATEINNTGLIVIQNGSTLSGQAWYNTTTIVTVDTTAFNYSRFGTSGTVTSVATGTGLTGGTITSSGTLSFAAIGAHKLWANVTAGSAVPTEVATSTFIQSVSVQVLAASATYTPTTGMVFCVVEIVGAGGGSGGAAGTAGQAGASAGGGGGGYCRKTYTAAQIGASAAVVIGTGGIAGTAGNNTGGTGVSSTFTPAGGGATLTATGGVGGGGSASSATLIISNNSGTGGSGTNGDINIAGGSGTPGYVLSNSIGGNAGAGGGSYFAPLNPNFATGNGAPLVGIAYGQGAAGANNYSGGNVTGQAGGAGVCYITEYIAL